MNYLTVKEIAAQWEVSTNLVSRYCAEDKIPGVKKEKGKWLIPDDAQKPIDGRRKIEVEEDILFAYNEVKYTKYLIRFK